MTAARDARGGHRFRPSRIATLTCALGLLVLVGLGVWQLQRLDWKTALIRDMRERMALPPAEAGQAGDFSPLDEWLYRPVRVAGIFAYDKTIYLPHGRGYDVLTPLLRPGLPPLLVIRGHLRDLAGFRPRPEDPALWGRVVVEAVLRPPRRRGLLTPDNDRSRRIRYDEDPHEIAAWLAIPEPVPAIFVARQPVGEGLERAALPALPRNPHLGYALTWFALAVALLVIYVRHGLMRAREESR